MPRFLRGLRRAEAARLAMDHEYDEVVVNPDARAELVVDDAGTHVWVQAWVRVPGLSTPPEDS